LLKKKMAAMRADLDSQCHWVLTNTGYNELRRLQQVRPPCPTCGK